MKRFRRLRQPQQLRKIIQETRLSVHDLIMPIFVVCGENIKKEIPSMPDIYHWSIDRVLEEVDALDRLGIHQIILFGLPEEKDEEGSQACCGEGIVQKAIRHIKNHAPHFFIITDICMCQYTSHGHCGILQPNGLIDNDLTLSRLSSIALSHVEAGADMVAPSDMMDGRIAAIRESLDQAGYTYIPIMSYSLKYASNYYGPFRQAANSKPQFGDRQSYQMDYHNKRDVLEIMQEDIDQGADLIMVKPAMSYLDHVQTLKNESCKPIVVYNVSGEYAMIQNAIKENLVNEAIIYETLIGFKRAGADLIITYFAKTCVEKFI